MTRRLVLIGGAVLFVAFAVYGSFVPFNLRRVPFYEALTTFKATRFIPLGLASRSDLVTNILLFVPVGFFMLGALAYRTRLAPLLAIPVLGVAFAISVAIEFGQIFVRGRTPSLNDVAAETIGAVVGVVLWMVVGSRVTDWLAVFFQHDVAGPRERAFRVLGAYVGVWAVLAALPLDFTLRLQELAEKFRAGRVVLRPFAEFTLRDVGGTLLMAVPLGVFGVLWATLRGWPRPQCLGLGLGAAMVVAGEGLQLLSMSRTADVTDIVTGLAGVVIGVAGARRWLATREVDAGRFRLWPVVALTGWVLALIVRHWSPFDFVASGDFIRGRVPAFLQVPFSGYYWGLAPAVLVDASTKLLMGIPVGAFLQLVWRPARPWLSYLAAGAAVLISACIFLVIELGQLLLPSRFPDQTDVFIGTAGAIVGVGLVRVLSRASAPADAPAESPPLPPAGS